MKVIYDHQVFTWQDYGGISRYYYELIRHFRASSAIKAKLSIKYSNNYYLLMDDYLSKDILPKPSMRTKKTVLEKILKKPKLELSTTENPQKSVELLQMGDFDLFHPTYYDPYFLNYIQSKPFVLTVYDMIHELFPEYFLLEDPATQYKKLLFPRAAKIIAISENTKKDIIDIYGIDESKIDVIYLGSSFKGDLNYYKQPLSLPKRYILFVGTRVTYKNFYFFVNSIAKNLQDDPGLCLICAGAGPFTQKEIIFLKNLGVNEQVIYYEASNENLIQLYKNALVFVFPSLYEGFGIPVLEAFSCGCPVILSRNSSLTEIGKDAVAYIDPKSIISIRDTVSKVVNDEMLREYLRQRGYEEVKKYSWEKCANETGNLYDEVLRKH